MYVIAMSLLLAASYVPIAEAPVNAEALAARSILARIRTAGLVPLSRSDVDASLQGLRGHTRVLNQTVYSNPVEDVYWESTTGQCLAYFGETTGGQPPQYGDV